MASLEIRMVWTDFEMIDLLYMKENEIWKKSTRIDGITKTVICDRFFHGSDHREELKTDGEKHNYLVKFLQDMKVKQEMDIDKDDDFETIITFTPDPAEDRIYEVYEGFMPDLTKKLMMVKRKCDKYGCDFWYEEVGETYKEVYTGKEDPYTGKPIYVTCRFVLIKAHGTAVINDWEFIASVEHTEAGNIYSKAMNDVEIPVRYRTTGSCTCEHCKTKRMRKDTFIIRNTKTDQFMQVGKSCLRDFTGGMSASGMTWFASIRSIFQNAEEEKIDYSGMRWCEKNYSVEEILQYTAETIRHFGFAPSDSDYPTKSRMMDFFDLTHGNTKYWETKEINRVRNLMESVGFNADSPEAVQMASDALEWIKSQESTTDYIHNLKTACALQYVNSGKFGLLVSLFPAWNRELEYQARKKREAEEGKISNHVGKIGDRITVNVESVKCLTSWESCFGYYPTVTYLYKITGQDGNIYTWKTQKGLDEDHPPKTIKGTVKAHNEFREVKQTELTRCKIA